MARTTVNRVDINLARRLREARREAGLSTRAISAQLPKGIAVSHSTVASYENGTTMPPLDVLAALADLYVRPINWFLEGGDTIGGFRYQNLKSRVPLTQQRQFEALVTKWADAYVKLDKRLGGFAKRTKVPEFGSIDLPPNQLAELVRTNFLNLDDSQPVLSVVSALEQFTAWALEQRATFGLDGAVAQYGGNVVVVLNPETSNERIRLTAANELARVFYADCQKEYNWSSGVLDKKAYDFALWLLLPHSQLQEAFNGKSFLKLIQYKERFGVALSAMVHMAEKAGVISTTVSRWLWKEMIQRGWRLEEPGYVWRDRAVAFETMLDCAIQTKTLSWDEAERVTGITEYELRQRIVNSTAIPKQKADDGQDREASTISFRPLRIADEVEVGDQKDAKN